MKKRFILMLKLNHTQFQSPQDTESLYSQELKRTFVTVKMMQNAANLFLL